MRGIRRIPAAAVVAAVSVVLLAGCTGDEAARAGSPTAPAYLQVTPHADAPSPSPVPSPSATPEAALPPQPSPAAPREPVQAATPLQVQPVQGTPGEPYDPRQVYDAVVVELNKLLVNPDPDQLELTVSRECDCYQQYYDYFAGLVTRRERWERPAGPNLLFFEVITSEEASFTADIVDAPSPNVLLRLDEPSFTEEPPLGDPIAKRVSLRAENGSWRLVQLQELVDADGENLGRQRIPGEGA